MDMAWTSVGGASSYPIQSCAMTSAGCLPNSLLYSPTTNSYSTTLDTTSANGHLYFVTAQDSCSTSTPSNVAVQYVRPLKLASGNLGVNWVSLPFFNNTATAKSICTDIGANAASVAKYNVATDTFTTFTCLLTGPGFSTTEGEAYLIKVKNADTDWRIVGSHDNAFTVNLKAATGGNLGVNWISIPYNTTATVAHDICTQAGSNTASVAKYNVANDTFTTHTCALATINNFNLTPGEAYLIKVSADTSWVPAHY